MLTAEPPRPAGNEFAPPPGYRFMLPIWGRRTDVFVAVNTKEESAATQHFNHLQSAPMYGRDLSLLYNPSVSSNLTASSGIAFSECPYAKSSVAQFDGYNKPAMEERVIQRSRVGFRGGYRLREAKTVNELLKAAYDVLEMHRTNMIKRNVRHRDTVPQIQKPHIRRQAHQNSLLTAQSILLGKHCPVEDRFPTCFVIDHDNAARMSYKDISPQDLVYRNGTPVYVARSVSNGVVLTGDIYCLVYRLPQLSENARTLYINSYGEKRYERYDDTATMPHGACPPDFDDDHQRQPEFRHRWEHGVESIYWSMSLALLHVRPLAAEGESDTTRTFEDTWESLLAHRIPKAHEGYSDSRNLLLNQSRETWRWLFLRSMKDIGVLLWNIARQIRPEYALCGDGLLPDHLHEAVQRLILQYLVDHDDVPLDPDHLRPIPQLRRVTAKRSSRWITTQPAASGSGVKRRSGVFEEAGEHLGAGTALEGESVAQYAVQSDGSGLSAFRAPATPALNSIPVSSKRKRSIQMERSSKHPRHDSCVPQSIEEHAVVDA